MVGVDALLKTKRLPYERDYGYSRLPTMTVPAFAACQRAGGRLYVDHYGKVQLFFIHLTSFFFSVYR